MPRHYALRMLLGTVLATVFAVSAWLIVDRLTTPQLDTPLQKNIAGHPRVYLDDDGIAALKVAITDTHAPIWTQVVAWVDNQIDATPPRTLEGDFRRVGELIPYAAMCYLLTDDTQYRDLAIRFMQGIVDAKHWGDDEDIEAAHLLYGLAVGYDWLYPSLATTTRDAVRNKLILQGKRLQRACGMVHPPLNNHRVVKLSSLGVAALALFPDKPASDWIPFVNREFEKALPYFGSDGMSCEGISYWSYSVEYMLKYFTAADALLGTQFLAHPWIQNAAEMPLYFALPPKAWTATNMFINIADSPRFCWYGPHYQLYKLASLTRSAEAQGLATQIHSAGFSHQRADWLSLLWFDPSLAAAPPKALPLTKVFADWDVAILRSAWDDDASLLSFTCSPIGGHQLSDIRNPVYPGSGHCHPDANSFTLFSHGEWLVADSGPALTKRTRNHNTLLIANQGQLGEGNRWLDGERQLREKHAPRFVYHESKAHYEYLVGDASGLYPKDADLHSFLRHFIYIRPDVLIIIDEVVTERPSSIEWLLHAPGTIETDGKASARVKQADAHLALTWLATGESTSAVTACETEGDPTQKDWDQLNVLSITSEGATQAWMTTAAVMGTSSASITLAASEPGHVTVLIRTEGQRKTIDIAFTDMGRTRLHPQIIDHITVRDVSGDADGNL